jgi:hypothetical protein
MNKACSALGESRNGYRILVGKPEGKNHSEDLGVDGRIGLILKWIFGILVLRVWIGFMWLRIGTSGGLF